MFRPMISVVVAVFNSEKTIEKNLQAIFHQDYFSSQGKLDLIVVDDGSTDATPEILSTFKAIKCFRQINSGPAAARNRGAQLAQGDFIFFTDSDCVPAPDWISKAMTHFSDPSVGVVAGSYGIMNDQNLLARIIYQEIIFRHHALMPAYPKVFGSYNFGIRRKVFFEVGGFNTRYRYPSGEDNDLSYKIISAGYKIYFARDSLVKHYHPSRISKYLREQYRHGFWRVKMYRDHPGMAGGDDYTFWKDIVEIPIVLIFLISLIPLVSQQFLFFGVGFIIIFFLWIIELFYGLVMTRDQLVSSVFPPKTFLAWLKEGFFLSGIMWLRAFARTLGFSSGFFHFLVKNE